MSSKLPGPVVRCVLGESPFLCSTVPMSVFCSWPASFRYGRLPVIPFNVLGGIVALNELAMTHCLRFSTMVSMKVESAPLFPTTRSCCPLCLGRITFLYSTVPMSVLCSWPANFRYGRLPVIPFNVLGATVALNELAMIHCLLPPYTKTS